MMGCGEAISSRPMRLLQPMHPLRRHRASRVIRPSHQRRHMPRSVSDSPLAINCGFNTGEF